jgi:hypothetical protein
MSNYTILSNLFETVLFYQIFVFIVVILEGKKTNIECLGRCSFCFFSVFEKFVLLFKNIKFIIYYLLFFNNFDILILKKIFLIYF